jgi:hypothetical protein
MLFYTDKEGKVILHPDAYKVCPEFKVLNEKDMLYVILFTDYYSHFAQFPEMERKKKARGWVYGMKAEDPQKRPEIREAIELYNDLQFDEDRHLYRVYQNKMRNLQLLYQNETDPDRSDKYLKAIENLKKSMADLHRQISSNTRVEYVLKGDKKMSFLEKLRKKKKYAEMIKERREKLASITIKNETNKGSEGKENIIR